MRPPTARERQVLDFLIAYAKQNSMAPKHQEISDALGGISPATVWDHLKALETKGYIIREHNQHRAIVVLHDPDHPDVCPSCQRPFAESTT